MPTHVAGDAGAVAWANGVDAALAGKLDSTVASGTYGTPVGVPTGIASTDTAALVAAHGSLPAGGGSIILSPGIYSLNPVTFSKAVKIVGAGGTSPLGVSGTILELNSATADALTFNADGCVLEDLTVRNTSATKPTAGAGIRFLKGDWAHLNRVTVIGFYDCISFDTGYYYTITDCRIYDPVRYGVFLRNTTTGQFDFGDQSITNTVFTSYFHNWNAAAAVRWESGGGMKFVGNKINGNAQPSAGHVAGTINGGGLFGVGLDWAVADGVSTVDLMVAGCSLENCTTAMVRVMEAGPAWTGFFSNIVITGNEIGFGYASCTGIILDSHDLGHVTTAIITGNTFTNLPNGSIYASKIPGLTIGANIHAGVTGPLVHLGSECYSADIATQSSRDNNAVILLDDTAATFSAFGPFGNIEHAYHREIPASVTLTYGEMFQFDVPLYGSTRFDLTVTGQVVGVGSVYRNLAGYCFRDAGGVTVGAFDRDVVGGTSTLDVSFDVTTAGTVKVKAKLPTGSGGTGIAGRVTLKLDGGVPRVLRS